MSSTEKDVDNGNDAHVLVHNIPSEFHSSDLRRFFSEWTETERFRCFHFRHRPELQTPNAKSDPDEKKKNIKTCCCLIRIREEDWGPFKARYHDTHWTDPGHETLSSKCFLVKVKVVKEDVKSGTEASKQLLSEKDLNSLLELKPPSVMPRGNVGTPTAFFLQAIQECRLPTKIIAKLKLEFPRARRRRIYGNVPFQYDSKAGQNFVDRKILADKAKTPGLAPAKEGGDSDPDDDDDTCEEWERHESLHDDVAARRVDPQDISGQPGTKERLFEEEMEVTWDKGSSGLVFYTDAQVWKAQEGDFDEQTTDDWDVDYSVYYDRNGGDKDARDSLSMRQSDHFRGGRNLKSVFKREDHYDEPGPSKGKKGSGGGGKNDGKIGSFERHTKGFGRKLMESQGWKDGQGLGTTFPGMADALDAGDGQVGRSGFGYHGEALPRFLAPKPPGRQRTSIRDVIISTKYDTPESVDPDEKLLRRNPQVYLKHKRREAKDGNETKDHK